MDMDHVIKKSLYGCIGTLELEFLRPLTEEELRIITVAYMIGARDAVRIMRDTEKELKAVAQA